MIYLLNDNHYDLNDLNFICNLRCLIILNILIKYTQ